MTTNPVDLWYIMLDLERKARGYYLQCFVRYDFRKDGFYCINSQRRRYRQQKKLGTMLMQHARKVKTWSWINK